MSICYDSLDNSVPEQNEIKKRIDNNIRILRKQWVKEVYEGLDYVEKHMGDVLVSGILNKLKRAADQISSSVIKKIYNLFLADLKEKTVKQIDVFIKCAKLYDETNLEGLLDEYTKDYLKNDLTYKSCDRKHENFEKIKECQVSTLRHRIIVTHKLMICDGLASSDKDIIRESYPDYESAKNHLYKQINYTRKAINLIFKDDDILKVNSLIKRPVLDILRMGYEYAVQHLISNLKDIYGKN